jgi:hypothetical protein
MVHSKKFTKACERCRTSKKKCVFTQNASKCKRCMYFNHACVRVPSNQGTRSDIFPTRPHSTNKDSTINERQETHFCSTNAAVESCSSIVEPLLEQCPQDGRDSVNSSLGVEYDVDVKTLGKGHESSIHSLHEGVDLSFVYDSSVESTDNIKMTDCNSTGQRLLFFVSNSAHLFAKTVSRRFKMDDEGRATFIQCTSLCFNRSCLRGSLIVFQTTQSPCWRLGIVSLFKYSHNGSGDDMLTMYEWIGKVSKDGTPKMFDCVSWDELSVHLNLVTLRIDDVKGYFVNQVCLLSSLCHAFFPSNISCSHYIMLNCFRSEVDHF